MAVSAEYPDLPFVPPRAWGAGRDGKSVMYAVIHYTAGAERNSSAEDGAAYDQRRTNGVSTHYFHDADSTVQCVHTRDRANSAFHKGNRLGIQHELCGTAQTRAQWLDAQSDPTLTRAAHQVARDCVKYGLPVRRLTVAETRAAWYSWPNGPKGIVGHVDVTYAYPEDGGTHTDPGVDFPWDIFLARVQDFIDGGDDDVLTPNQEQQLTNVHDILIKLAQGKAGNIHPHVQISPVNEWLKSAAEGLAVLNELGPLEAKLDQVLFRLGEAGTGGGVPADLDTRIEAAVRRVLGSLDETGG